MFWARTANFLGQTVVQKIADNSDLLVSAVDNMAGGNDLITVRARREIVRPFTRVEDMQRRADQKLIQERDVLEQKERDLMDKLAEQQRQRGDQSNVFTPTPEQKKLIEGYNAELLVTRKQLRAIRLNLRRDIETLGAELKFVNIALVPLVVCIAAVALWTIRGLRRRAARLSATA